MSRARFPTRSGSGCCECRTRQGKRDLALLHLLGSAGLRRAEAARVQLADVDERRRASDPRLRQAIKGSTSWWVTVRHGKRGRTRAIPLDDDALDAIVAWVKSRPAAPAEHLLLSLPRAGQPKPLTTRDIARIVTRHAQAADLPEGRRSPHVLRHTSAPTSPTPATTRRSSASWPATPTSAPRRSTPRSTPAGSSTPSPSAPTAAAVPDAPPPAAERRRNKAPSARAGRTTSSPTEAGSGRGGAAEIPIPLPARSSAAAGGAPSGSMQSHPDLPGVRAMSAASRTALSTDAWIAAREAAENSCWEDWNAEHFEALLGYEPSSELILGRSDGGLRHFLNGQPVHAGSSLELLLADGSWLRIRYEWSWQPDVQPTAYTALGVPTAATDLIDPPLVSFELPSRAILRWPEDRS